MVLGVGGAGSNAVNHMHTLGIDNVVLAICNTDRQALQYSDISIKIQLGDGDGAGNNPDVARQAVLKSLDEITGTLNREGTKMLFLAAGMGGGTGTGASAAIAKAAKDMGILTVAIVSLPLMGEGPKRVNQAKKGLEELRQEVDSLVIVQNDNIPKIYGDLPFEEALGKADEILALSAKSISEIISRHHRINVDLADVRTVMLDSGLALMGTARARGENCIEEVVNQTLNSPLLNYKNIRGAKNVLFNLSHGPNSGYTMNMHTQLLDMIQRNASGDSDSRDSNIIPGSGLREDLGDEIELTVIATGFSDLPDDKAENSKKQSSVKKKRESNESIISSLIRKSKERLNQILESAEDVTI